MVEKIKGFSTSVFKNEMSWLENSQMGNGHMIHVAGSFFIYVC